MTFYEITEKDRELIDAAMKVMRDCFDDGVYHHTVGAALLCKSGKIVTGINCYAIHGSCAEYIAIGKAITQGEREFDTIVAVHEHALNNVYPPCGNCRQLMIEYAPNIKVIVNDDDGNLTKVSIKDLLPFAWQEVVV